MVVKGLTKGRKVWEMAQKGDFLHFFGMPSKIEAEKTESAPFPQVIHEICLIR